jgi:hypothetical protein
LLHQTSQASSVGGGGPPAGHGRGAGGRLRLCVCERRRALAPLRSATSC